jgi:hypothetical protein
MDEDPSSFVKGDNEANPYFSKGGQGEGKKSFETVKR